MRLLTWLIPVLALGLLLLALAVGMGTYLVVLCGAALVGSVLVAVHHAEVVAHRVGEPFGTLILALAITAIEAALILWCYLRRFCFSRSCPESELRRKIRPSSPTASEEQVVRMIGGR
jgi:Ca2+/H+ antiporter